MGAVQYSRSGRPDTEVHTSPFEPLSCLLGPLSVDGSFISYNDILGGSGSSRMSGGGR